MIPFLHVLGVKTKSTSVAKQNVGVRNLRNNVRHCASALNDTKTLGVHAIELHDTRLAHDLSNDTKCLVFSDMLQCHKVAGVVHHRNSSLSRHGRTRKALTRGRSKSFWTLC